MCCCNGQLQWLWADSLQRTDAERISQRLLRGVTMVLLHLQEKGVFPLTQDWPPNASRHAEAWGPGWAFSPWGCWTQLKHWLNPPWKQEASVSECCLDSMWHRQEVSPCVFYLHCKAVLEQSAVVAVLGTNVCYFAVSLLSKGFVFNWIKLIGSCDCCRTDGNA